MDRADGPESSASRGPSRGRAPGWTASYRHVLAATVDTAHPQTVCCNIQSPSGWRPLQIPQEVTLPPRHDRAPREVTPADIAAIDAYAPRKMPGHRWRAIRGFVNDLARDYLPHTREETGKVQLTIARYVDWAVHDAGLDMTRDVLLDPEMVVYFVANRLDVSSVSTRQQYRAVLLRMVDSLRPDRRRLLNVRSYGKQDAVPPFTLGELAMVLRWPMEQRTAYRRFNAACLVHFGLGAGIRHEELVHVTREDVVEDDLGVVIHVRHGKFPRTVPVLGAHEDAVVVLADSVAPGSRIYRSDQKAVSVSVASSWVWSTFTPVLGSAFNPQRARSTWVVGHLDWGVSATVLIRAAGMGSFTGLQRYLAHTKAIDKDAVRLELSRLEDQRKHDDGYYARTAEYRAARAAQRYKRSRQRDEFRRGVS